MNNDKLLLRRQQLLLRSSELRVELAQQALIFRRPLALADKAQSSMLWLYRNPVWSLGALTILIALRPRRILTWGGGLWYAWTKLQGTRNWLNALASAKR